MSQIDHNKQDGGDPSGTGVSPPAVEGLEQGETYRADKIKVLEGL